MIFTILDLNHTSHQLVFCLSGSRGFENCFHLNYKPHLIRQRWLHYCVVLSGLDPDTELAKIRIFPQGTLKKTSQFKTILDPAMDGKGIAIKSKTHLGEAFIRSKALMEKFLRLTCFKGTQLIFIYHMNSF